MGIEISFLKRRKEIKKSFQCNQFYLS